MKNFILFFLVVSFSLCISATHSQSSSGLTQKSVLQEAQTVLDVDYVISQKTKLASLPDNQRIRMKGGVIKTVAQIKLDIQNQRGVLEAKSKSVAAQALKDFDTYKAKFEASQLEMRKQFELKRTQLVAKVQMQNTKLGSSSAQLPFHAKTPVIAALDPDHGRFGESVLITGSDFQSQPGKVRILASANSWLEADIALWTDTQIVAIVPDNSGNPDYDGVLVVKVSTGEQSAAKRFRITSEEEVSLLPGTDANATLDASLNLQHCMVAYLENTGVGSATDWMVYHHLAAGSTTNIGCVSRDYLWQNLTLKNGWIVDKVVVTKVSTDEINRIWLWNDPVGTSIPMLCVNWQLGESSDAVYMFLSYQAQVYIRGPKGVPYK